ncbi:hypothetical protein GCM10010358_03570 [Streptomyces minutiscleroticus]|uniref:Secreted protein n=1 Tax=Streptomyces minutiscleroticus TaxID=68238 RepID=A0A918K7C4_9ACTN|nr:hypothetical protein [Streptomyces minutiscleroticus]GGX53031.1 hypothetical protein GCM10010358_03570 [Streptomyces minutiscleroticus]
MSRRRTLGPKKKLALLMGAAAVAGSGAFALASTSNAAPAERAGSSVVCQGLATALADNERFIEQQRAAPDAQSQARIANREAVVEEIQRKQAASGCPIGAGDGGAGGAAAGTAAPSSAASAPADGTGTGGEAGAGSGDGAGAGKGAGSGAGDGAGSAGEQVCAGSTVTLSGEAGAPAASSDRFPAGTRLKVTNLDNGRSTTVEVTSVSGSCVLLNDAAFEQVREAGRFLVRNARVERAG